MKQEGVYAQSVWPEQRMDSVWSRTLGGGQLLKISVVSKVSGDGTPSNPSAITHRPEFWCPTATWFSRQKGSKLWRVALNNSHWESCQIWCNSGWRRRPHERGFLENLCLCQKHRETQKTENETNTPARSEKFLKLIVWRGGINQILFGLTHAGAIRDLSTPPWATTHFASPVPTAVWEAPVALETGCSREAKSSGKLGQQLRSQHQCFKQKIVQNRHSPIGMREGNEKEKWLFQAHKQNGGGQHTAFPKEAWKGVAYDTHPPEWFLAI